MLCECRNADGMSGEGGGDGGRLGELWLFRRFRLGLWRESRESHATHGALLAEDALGRRAEPGKRGTPQGPWGGFLEETVLGEAENFGGAKEALLGLEHLGMILEGSGCFGGFPGWCCAAVKFQGFF